MSIQLRLDAAALAALFPEGSQARVDLQQAVVAEFAKKYIKPSAAGLQAMVDKARAEAVAEVMKELGLSRGAYSSNPVKLSDGVKYEIDQAARAAVREHSRERIEDYAKNAAATTAHDAKVLVSRLVDEEIRASIRAKVQEASNAVLGVTKA